jgi:O-antigen/teichoic acid export membrane protein
MTLIKKNIIANLAGNIWSAIMSLAFIPIYIHFMGIESYALIGIYITLMAVSMILDMGMSVTINREMARLTSQPDKAQESINLVRTMEALIWIIAVLVGLLIFLLAHPIAYHWVNPDALPAETVRQAILLMGFSMIFQWPCSFYSSGFIGLQKQVLLNVITASIATFRGVGVILILWLVSPTIQAFFIWQVVVSVLQFCISVTLFKKNLPNTGKRAVFQFSLLTNLWRFAAGMGGISILGMLWSQMDKVILSKIETLENLGYYTLALVVATSFSRLMGPVVTALYPRFNQLIVLEQTEDLKRLYHKGCQVMSVLIMPFTFLLVFFSEEIILLWTQDPVTAERTGPLVAVLAVGTMFNG